MDTATTPTANAPGPETADATRTAELLADAAVVRWWQTTAVLDVSGPDALTLVDGLCTQAVTRLEPGTARLGLFLDAKAHVIAAAILHRHADAPWTDPRSGAVIDDAPVLRVELLPEQVEPLRAHLTRYRLRARVSIEATDLASIAVVGGGAERLSLPQPDPRDGEWTRFVSGLATMRPTVTFVGTAAAARRLVQQQLPALGLPGAAPDALEADRIAAGIAGLHDLLVGRMPAEVGGMADAVALDAGCYLGQEPVVRLHYRGRANRSLRRVRAQTAVSLAPGAQPDDEEPFALRRIDDDPSARPVGRLTTWATDVDGSTVALALLRRELEAGDTLALAGTEHRFTVVDGGESETPAESGDDAG